MKSMSKVGSIFWILKVLSLVQFIASIVNAISNIFQLSIYKKIGESTQRKKTYESYFDTLEMLRVISMFTDMLIFLLPIHMFILVVSCHAQQIAGGHDAALIRMAYFTLIWCDIMAQKTLSSFINLLSSISFNYFIYIVLWVAMMITIRRLTGPKIILCTSLFQVSVPCLERLEEVMQEIRGRIKLEKEYKKAKETIQPLFDNISISSLRTHLNPFMQGREYNMTVHSDTTIQKEL